jgi:anti-sigma B factor antagonist
MAEITLNPIYPGIKVIKPIGRIDRSNYQQFYQEAIALLATKTPPQSSLCQFILVDMQDVKFIDSRGLGALIKLLKAVRSSGQNLALCSINSNISLLLMVTSMCSLFNIFRSDRHFFDELEQSNSCSLMSLAFAA